MRTLLFLWLANLFTIEYPRRLCLIKNVLLRYAGLNIANKVFVDRGFRCLKPENITIRENTSLGHDNHIWAFAPIYIGSFTQTAKDVLFISGSHETDSYAPSLNQEIKVGPGCWIGTRSTILGGVTIGKGSIIGAGSLVKDNIPDWSIAVGVPARVIRTRTPADEIINPFGNYNPSQLDRDNNK